MNPRAAPPAFPEALVDDDDDVTWALQTAKVQWKRGAAEDAVEWLYRAIESAVDGGRTVRARQIQKQVNALETALRGGYQPNAAESQAGPRVGSGEAPPSGHAREADVDVPIDVENDLEEDTGLHTRRSIEAAKQAAAAAADEILDDADLVDEVEEIDAAEVIQLTKPRAVSIRPNRFRLEPEPSPASARPRARAHAPKTDLAESPERAAFDSEAVTHGADSVNTLAPERPEPTESIPLSSPEPSVVQMGSAFPDSAPPSVRNPEEEEPTERDPEDDEQPTERSMEAAIERQPVDVVGVLLPFPELPGDETTMREALSLPSEPSPSSSGREKLAEFEPGTSPDLSPLLGPPDSGPATEPTPASSRPARKVAPARDSAEIDAPPSSNGPSSKAASLPAPAPPALGDVLLSQVPGLEDLPEESQQALVTTAKIHTLEPSEDAGAFALSLVIKGNVSVMPAVADYVAARVTPGNLVFNQGHLEDGVELRIVAGAHGAEVATWDAADFEAAIADCPWVGDDLRAVGDRFQALSGVTMGRMGEQLDDMLRGLVVERCEVRWLLAGEVIAEKGKPIPGMVIVGAGRLELVETSSEAEQVLQALAPGDFLFASEILQAAPAPATARAGKGGALLLFAERKVAHELLMSVPPLLGIFVQ